MLTTFVMPEIIDLVPSPPRTADHEAGLKKLEDLRKAWVGYTLSPVSVAVQSVLEKVSLDLAIPNGAQYGLGSFVS